MHRTPKARAITNSRRSGHLQPAAIVNTLGLIAGLLLTWVVLVL